MHPDPGAEPWVSTWNVHRALKGCDFHVEVSGETLPSGPFKRHNGMPP